jgi:DNA-binding GntR family transcriptional regulator
MTPRQPADLPADIMISLDEIADRLGGSTLHGRKTTSDMIAETLREGILSGVLPEGFKLNQVSLAQYFDVSRIPLREAINKLVAEGLVSAQPHHTMQVAPLPLEHLVEVFQIRTQLETLAMREALAHLTDGDLATAEHILDKLEQTDDHRTWLALNDEFHETLCAKSDKHFLCNMIRSLRDRGQRYLWKSGHPLLRESEANAEHRRILDACRHADPDEVTAQVTNHLEATLDSLLKRFNESRQGAVSQR